jgi:hypothetical protein
VVRRTKEWHHLPRIFFWHINFRISYRIGRHDGKRR